MSKNNYPDSGLSYLISIVAFVLRITGKILAFPFRVWWHYINPLNVTRIKIENKRRSV